MEEKLKRIADHHDNVIRLSVETKNLIEDFKYIRDKNERDILYKKTSWNRVVDMKLSNYDKMIDLEIFLLKLFIPILGISFAAGVNIIGIDTYTLKWLSLSIIILVGLLITITFLFRKKIIDSEQKNYKLASDLTEKQFLDKMENLEICFKQIGKDIKLALENEPNLQ